MFRMSIETLTNGLVAALLKEPKPGEALHFVYDVSLVSPGDAGNGKRYERRECIHLMYHRPHLAYIHVFSAVTKISQRHAIQVPEGIRNGETTEGWTHQVSHDSEWRHPNAINDLYFQMSNDINAARQADGLMPAAPIDMEQNGHTTFGLVQTPFEWVKVHMTKDPTDPHQYRKIIKVLA